MFNIYCVTSNLNFQCFHMQEKCTFIHHALNLCSQHVCLEACYSLIHWILAFVSTYYNQIIAPIISELCRLLYVYGYWVVADTWIFFPFSMQIALFVSSSDAMQPGWLLTFLKSISPAQIKEMQRNLAKVCNLANLEGF